MEPSWRKPAGILGLLLYLVVYAIVVSQFGTTLAALPTVIEVIAYMLLGVLWIAPLRPLFLWMNTGQWRQK